MTTQWKAVTYDANLGIPHDDVLGRLREDTAAVIVLKNAVSKTYVQDLAQEVSSRRDQATVSAYSNGSLTTFGCYLAKHLKQPSAYFNSVSAGSDLFTSQRDDLRKIVRSQLQKMLGLDSLTVATEPNGLAYAPAVVRIHGNGVGNPLHNDNIMRDATGTGLRLADLRYQFSCITCIQECDEDGELLHYQRRWQPEHEQFKVQGGLGYHDGVVSGAEVCRFRPETGDVYIIDPTNFHAIRAVGGRDRITLGFFFGFFDQKCKSGVCWS
jgi:hypothetical protein